MAELVTLGELLVDFIARETGVEPGEAENWSAAPGGAPANVAVGAARLGIDTAFLGKVGDDPFGHMLSRTLEAEGVDTGGVRFDPAARTALAFVTLAEGGERHFHFYRHPSADMLYHPDEVDLDAVRVARVLHFGSISLIGEPSRSATFAAIDAAREAGLIVTFDPNLRLDLWTSTEEAKRTISEGWQRSRVVKVSEEELEFITGAREIEAAGELAENLDLLLVTRGPRGVDYLTRQGGGRVPGFDTTAVDTTGAGDSFMAALLCGLVRDAQLAERPEALREVLRFANACAAMTVAGRGAIPSLPTAEEADAFLARYSSASK